MQPFERIVVLVADSVGIGEMPDAAAFGDEGSDTLGHLAARRPLELPNLVRWGLGNIRPLEHLPPSPEPAASFGRMALAGAGKDTTSGHWEMMGVILEEPFPTYPDGFPPEVMQRFEAAIGRGSLGNVAASGTEIIERLGEEHLRTAKPIVYTSADSVFQIAAHEEVIPIGELYRICETARGILEGRHQVGRVIARPFVGRPGSFQRTARRKDYAIPPPIDTVLDRLQARGVPVTAIGKIASIYCHRGVDRELKTAGNPATAETTLEVLSEGGEGLVFANFVDFDMLYGHRNDPEGYSRALEEFDQDLGRIEAALDSKDLLVVVSDHGCDPTTPSTDHTREYALLLAFAPSQPKGRDLGTRGTLADLGATIAENFGVDSPAGTSFLEKVAPASFR